MTLAMHRHPMTPQEAQDGCPTPIEVLMRRRRDALMQEVRAIEDYLGLEPVVRARCPNCEKTWNKKQTA